MPKIILGIIGEMGSGKSTVAKYLKERYGASHYRFSDVLRDILDQLYLPLTRDNLIDLFLILASRFGDNVLARPMKRRVEQDDNSYIAIEGIRREDDISELRKLPDFHLIGVRSDSQARYDRIRERGENADDKTKTYEEFVKDHGKETEAGIPQMVENADIILENDGSLDDLKAKVDQIIDSLK